MPVKRPKSRSFPLRRRGISIVLFAGLCMVINLVVMGLAGSRLGKIDSNSQQQVPDLLRRVPPPGGVARVANEAEQTVRPRKTSPETFGFVHIGKTGGSTISQLLRNGCNSFVTGPCREVSNESMVSKLVEHCYHVSDFHRLPASKHKGFILTVRDVYDRTISALIYHHPENAKYYNIHLSKELIEDGPMAYQCIPTVEEFSRKIVPLSVCDYPHKHNVLNIENCTALACAVAHGKVRYGYFNHLFFNYRNILDTKIPKKPPRQIYVLRKESMWDDWRSLNALLGQKEEVTIPHEAVQRNVSGINLPITREVSTAGRMRICNVMKEEYEAYFRILLRAVNLLPKDVQRSVEISEINCPNLNLGAMVKRLRLEIARE